MEGFQDERPNGELSSSDSEEAIDDYPYRAASSSKGHPSQTTTSANKPNLVNGHSPKTYHNGFRGRGEEPVVKKGVPSRDYFEDSDSYPKLVSPGEGEPDICDDAEYCDSDNNEDQTQQAQVLHDNGDTDLDVGDSIAESHKADVRSDESVTFQPNSGLNGRTESRTDTESRNGSKNFALHSENSKDIHDSIVFRSQVTGHNEPIRGENGATLRLDGDFKSLDTKQSDMVAQYTDMDRNTHKDDELMVSISGSGKISLVPADEPRKPTVISHQKGSYVGPAEHKKASDTGFSDQKKRFEALRKKFSEPGSFSKSSSDSDSEENRQNRTDEPQQQKHIDHKPVPLPDKNSREEDSHVAIQGNLFYYSPEKN